MNFFSLLKLEVQRFFPNTTFRVIVALYAIFFILLWVLANKIGTNFTFTSNGHSYRPAADFFLYPQNWQLLAYIGSWLNAALMGFLGVFMITLEFNCKTLRQSVIFGLSRNDLFVSKAGSAIALAAAATVCYVVLGCFGGFTPGTDSVPVSSLVPLKSALGFLLQSLGYFLMGTLFGLLIRQTALATLGYLAYVFFLENVCSWLFFYVVSKTRVLMFLPNAVLAKLTPFPVPKFVENMGADSFSIPISPLEATVAAAVYLCLFAFILQRRLSRSDL